MTTLTTAVASVDGAGPSPATVTDGGTRRYLTFSLHGEVYALDIVTVAEIITFRSLTVVPMMPSYVRGVINLRGRVLPVVDLAARFGREETRAGRRTVVLVVEAQDAAHGAGDTPAAGAEGLGRQAVGIMVDAVNKVVQLEDGEIAPPPGFGTGLPAGFVAGMATLDGDFAVVLDVEQVLALHQTTPAGAPGSPGSSGQDRP